jgi:aminopeptidase N
LLSGSFLMLKSVVLIGWVLVSAAAWAGVGGDVVLTQHELTVRLDPERHEISVTDRIRFASNLPSEFVLATALDVQRVTVEGAVVPAHRTNEQWHLELGDRDTHEMTIEYRGVIPDPGGDEGNGPVLGPSGTFLSGDAWYPDFGSPSVSFDLTVSVPPGQVAVAPGRLAAENSSAEGYTARFVSEAPMEEIALFAGPYRVEEKTHRGRRLRTYFHPEVADLAGVYLERTASYLDLYDEWIGEYPFSSFSVVSGPLPVGLGFAGFTYVGVQVLRLPFLPATSLGHEILHCWWGNGVLIDVGEGNWAEGLTTFMADYTYAERQGAEAARDMRLRWLREYAVLPEDRDLPLTQFRERHHTVSQVVGYHRAAMLFLMLRDELGTTVFDAGIRRFWETNRFRRAGWADLKQAFETAAQRSLDGFFTQWLERSGAPVLRVQNPAVRESKGSWEVSFLLGQSGWPYQLRVPVEIVTAAGAVSNHVDVKSSEQSFTIAVGERPVRLRIDPDFRLFRRLDSAEVPPILRGVAFDDEAPVVVADRGAEARKIARELAARFFERSPRVLEGDQRFPAGAVLVVGTESAVADLLARDELPMQPEDFAGRGTARAWSAQRPGGGTLVVVSARDLSALRAIVTLLPHYGGESFVVFEGRTAQERGLRPSGSSPLDVELTLPES